MIKVFVSSPSWSSDLVSLLSESLRSEGIECLSVADYPAGVDLQIETLSAIKRCDVLIAFVDKPWPNVMFELGCAIGSGKTVLLLRQSELAEIPKDIATLPTIRVDPYDARTVAEVVDWIKKATFKPIREPSLAGRPSEILRQLALDPSLLDECSPAGFEELVTDFLNEIGVRAHLVQQRMDFGFDIGLPHFAGREMVVVTVKKYNRNSRVSVNEVQRILGVAVASGAGCAIVVTSGQFTSSANYFAATSPVRIVLLTLEQLINLTKGDLWSLCES